MKWDKELFNQYLDNLQEHLFGDISVLEIIELAKRDHHQARRQMNLHVLRNRETFHDFYVKREELGIQSVYDQVISALFHETEKRPVKLEIIELLGIEQGVIESEVEGYGLKEFDKDLASFIFYRRKREGTVAEMVQEMLDRKKRGS
jgi:hypothetical protein